MNTQVLEKPKWKLQEPAFIEPHWLKEGTVFYYSGQPGAHMLPMNQAAQDKLDEYFKEHPEARLSGVEGLQMTMEKPEIEIISVPSNKDTGPVHSIQDMADGKAKREKPGFRPPEGAPTGDIVVEEVREVPDLSEADRLALEEVRQGQEAAAATKAAKLEEKQAKGAAT